MTKAVSSIEQQLKALVDPWLQQTLDEAGVIRSVTENEKQIDVQLCFPYPVSALQSDWQDKIESTLKTNKPIKLALSHSIKSYAVQKGLSGMPQIKNIIAVASGKGGVGKSTTAVNLALALQCEGASVGLLDADIYGPSQPRMLGAQESPQKGSQAKTMRPLMRFGLQTMSIGYLVDEDTAMIWRGAMVSSALQQLLQDTEWRDLDYLIIDLPPGTGDAQLTMAQKIPVSGSVIVTTPQDIALLDAKRAVNMFAKVSIPVLGIVENMSVYHCPQCGHQAQLFGADGGEQLAEKYGVPMLGQLPLHPSIREQTDHGLPTVAHDPNSDLSMHYRLAARRLSANLAKQTRDLRVSFPKIVVQDN